MSNLMKGGASLGRVGGNFAKPQMGLRRRGMPLPVEVRAQAEELFGQDFSDVRIIVSDAAPRMGAIAFTTGSEIHIAPGVYKPGTPETLALLGHELAHVVQQRQGRATNPYGYGMSVVRDQGLEAEADRMGRALQMAEQNPERTDKHKYDPTQSDNTPMLVSAKEQYESQPRVSEQEYEVFISVITSIYKTAGCPSVNNSYIEYQPIKRGDQSYFFQAGLRSAQSKRSAVVAKSGDNEAIAKTIAKQPGFLARFCANLCGARFEKDTKVHPQKDDAQEINNIVTSSLDTLTGLANVFADVVMTALEFIPVLGPIISLVGKGVFKAVKVAVETYLEENKVRPDNLWTKGRDGLLVTASEFTSAYKADLSSNYTLEQSRIIPAFAKILTCSQMMIMGYAKKEFTFEQYTSSLAIAVEMSRQKKLVQTETDYQPYLRDVLVMSQHSNIFSYACYCVANSLMPPSDPKEINL